MGGRRKRGKREGAKKGRRQEQPPQTANKHRRYHCTNNYHHNTTTTPTTHSASEAFLQRVVALLVASHYKNTPNDLLLLADAPAHQLFVLLAPVDETQVRSGGGGCCTQCAGLVSASCGLRATYNTALSPVVDTC